MLSNSFREFQFHEGPIKTGKILRKIQALEDVSIP